MALISQIWIGIVKSICNVSYVKIVLFHFSCKTQVVFEGGPVSLTKDVITRGSSFVFSDLKGLSLTNGNAYVAKVRSRNNLGAHSDYAQHNLWIQTEPPTVNG